MTPTLTADLFNQLLTFKVLKYSWFLPHRQKCVEWAINCQINTAYNLYTFPTCERTSHRNPNRTISDSLGAVCAPPPVTNEWRYMSIHGLSLLILCWFVCRIPTTAPKSPSIGSWVPTTSDILQRSAKRPWHCHPPPWFADAAPLWMCHLGVKRLVGTQGV